MKKILIMALVAASIGSLSSCADFLDREPMTKPEAGTFLTGQIQVENYINGLYITLPSFSKFGMGVRSEEKTVITSLRRNMTHVCMDRTISSAELPTGRPDFRICAK